MGEELTAGQEGGYRNKRMENAHYWAAQLLGWLKNGPNAGIRGTYYVDVIGGKPVLVTDGDEWTESTMQAVRDGLRHAGFPHPLRVKAFDDEYRLFLNRPSDDRLVSDLHPNWRVFEPTGGDRGDPAAMFATDQLEPPSPS